MSIKTVSETAFERFLAENSLPFERIAEGSEPRPDYAVQIADGVTMIFEVKQLSEDSDFHADGQSVSSRTVGDHIRKKILGARRQVRYGAAQGTPSVLLIYNDLDPMHLFGTEDMDFETAMYGEYTLRLDRRSGEVVDRFHGRNGCVAPAKNTSFSAVARLAPVGREQTLTVTLFENMFCKVPVPYDRLPPCFQVVRAELDTLAPARTRP